MLENKQFEVDKQKNNAIEIYVFRLVSHRYRKIRQKEKLKPIQNSRRFIFRQNSNKRCSSQEGIYLRYILVCEGANLWCRTRVDSQLNAYPKYRLDIDARHASSEQNHPRDHETKIKLRSETSIRHRHTCQKSDIARRVQNNIASDHSTDVDVTHSNRIENDDFVGCSLFLPRADRTCPTLHRRIRISTKFPETRVPSTVVKKMPP